MNPGVCRGIQCSSPLPTCRQAPGTRPASLTAPQLFPRPAASTFSSSGPAGSSRRRLPCSCPVPCTPREKNAALQKQGRNKAAKSSFVIFSFLGHFELIKECDLNYKYPPSRMIYGLFVLEWYVLNL